MDSKFAAILGLFVLMATVPVAQSDSAIINGLAVDKQIDNNQVPPGGYQQAGKPLDNLITSKEHALTLEQYMKIKVGTTKDDVLRIAGPPTEEKIEGLDAQNLLIFVWYYYSSKSDLPDSTIVFADHAVISKSRDSFNPYNSHNMP